MSAQTATASESSIVVMIAGEENAVHIGADRPLSAVAHARYLNKFTKAKPELERRLLIPYFQGVPFQEAARAAELDFLDAWLAAPERVSVRTLIGPAGSGTIRPAVEFLRGQLAARLAPFSHGLLGPRRRNGRDEFATNARAFSSPYPRSTPKHRPGEPTWGREPAGEHN